MESFAGVVLTGGRSRRFGRDKARFFHRGLPLSAWVMASFADARVRFLVGRGPSPLAGVPLYPDRLGEGPLAGIHAALLQSPAPWVALAATDLVGLSPRFWRLLWARRGGAPVVVAEGPGGAPEPLAALYARGLWPLAERLLLTGERRARALLLAVPAVVVPWAAVWAAAGEGALLNANRPADLLTKP